MGPKLDDLLGALLLGIIVSAVVYGITCLQTYSYYVTFGQTDRPFLQILVAALWVFDTLHLAVLMHAVYFYSVSHFGDFGAIARKPVWSIEASCTIGGIITLLVQGFYALRVYRLSHGSNWWLPLIIVTLSLVQLAFAITFTAVGLRQFKSLGFTLQITKPYVIVGLANDIACDVSITTAMIYYLRKGRTGFSSSNRVINLLITYTINTCLLTTICTIGTLGLFVARPLTFLYAPFYIIVCRLYANALLATLNSRETIRKKMYESDNVIEFKAVTKSGSSGTSYTTAAAPPPVLPKEDWEMTQSLPRIVEFNPRLDVLDITRHDSSEGHSSEQQGFGSADEHF